MQNAPRRLGEQIIPVAHPRQGRPSSQWPHTKTGSGREKTRRTGKQQLKQAAYGATMLRRPRFAQGK
jgi:hypothetical protein